MTTNEMLMNIIAGTVGSTVIALTASAILKKHRTNREKNEERAERDIQTMEGADDIISNAKSIEDVIFAMGVANNIYHLHNDDEKFCKLNIRVTDHAVKKACEFLEKEKKEA